MGEKSLRARLALPAGQPVDLSAIDTRATPGDPGGEKKAIAAGLTISRELEDLQERMFAQAEVEGSPRRLLLVLQGMDSSGKDSAVKHGLAGMNAKWIHAASFKAPTEVELRHHFLWRIRRQVPAPGMVGVFIRSHYEDVLVVRVHELVPEEVWRPRFKEINSFERELAADGVAIVKVFLHISRDYQRERQLRRLERVDKRWKFDPGDLDDRERWADFQAAYEEALQRCNTPWAPWYVVPADNKWYRIWAVSRLVLETMREMDLRYPERPELDIPALKARLLAS